MRIELVILLITAFFIANIYHNGKYIKLLKQGKKYYQMGAVAFLGLSSYLFIKKKPTEAQGLLSCANDLIRAMPVDKASTDFLTPFMNTANGGSKQISSSILSANSGAETARVKRSVGETKKKFVASRQDWCCAKCNSKLSAWFEIDHIQRLDRGGSNHVDNLEALCRECHGAKTAMEKM